MSTPELYPYPQQEDEVRTLFVSGFPDDVKEREIHNLFRLCPGYEGCKLSLNQGKVPVAFATFSDRTSAMVAIRSLEGIRFDPSYPQKLRIEFARSNSKTRRLLDEPQIVRFDPRRRRESSWRSDVPPPPGGMFFPEYGATPTYPYSPSNTPWGYLPDRTDLYHMGIEPPRKSRTPNTTLYVSGIESHISQVDLSRLFGSISRFKRLRLTRKETTSFAFVEYYDLQASIRAIYTLNGHLLGKTPLRIEFARNKMGERGRGSPHPNNHVVNMDNSSLDTNLEGGSSPD
eukprot:TRINITY_DN2093_c0_g2_i12.p1 TRINITY_DN2093_c0_g2~~TRINITY_DN2093_c0_g2_i12.p1  ORF type:complete len:287 (+),score=41.78 TRINITY_DN2093_c0_g2_i12:235-1095(+)